MSTDCYYDPYKSFFFHSLLYSCWESYIHSKTAEPKAVHGDVDATIDSTICDLIAAGKRVFRNVENRKLPLTDKLRTEIVLRPVSNFQDKKGPFKAIA
jgi:hypothetical protein